DVSLDLIRLFSSYLHLRSGDLSGSDGDYSFLVSRNGKIIAHPDEKLMPREGLPAADASGLPDGKFVVAKPNRVETFRLGKENRRIYWVTASKSHWKVALDVPEALILRPATALARQTFLIAAFALALMLTVLVVVTRRLTEPVRRITAVAESVESEN